LRRGGAPAAARLVHQLFVVLVLVGRLVLELLVVDHQLYVVGINGW
jgi:hypothetical protein